MMLSSLVRPLKRILAVALAAFVATAAAAQPAAKPRVLLLATGGTIAGVQPSDGSGQSYRPGVVGVDALVDAVPGLRDRAEIKAEQLMNIGSNNMNDETWLKLAHRVIAGLADPSVDAIVITHGTDTMEESAFLLSLTTGGDKPVVLVGSMRPATAISADGPGNLLDAVTVAAHPSARSRGIMVVLNNTIHGARDVTKVNTLRPDAFDSPNAGPLGWVDGTEVKFYHPAPATRGAPTFALAADAVLPRVDVIYVHAGTDDVLIKASVAAGARGIVIAGSGAGSMTTPAREAVRALAKEGVVFFRTARHSYGPVTLSDAGAGSGSDEMVGTLAGTDLTPAKARVFLKLALMKPGVTRADLLALIARL
ncbi:asparaginase [Opitutaceae bacterium]